MAGLPEPTGVVVIKTNQTVIIAEHPMRSAAAAFHAAEAVAYELRSYDY